MGYIRRNLRRNSGSMPTELSDFIGYKERGTIVQNGLKGQQEPRFALVLISIYHFLAQCLFFMSYFCSQCTTGTSRWKGTAHLT